MVTRIFCDPGDVILAEGPSYVGALGSFNAYQAEVVHVPMDEEGLQPQALREAIAAIRDPSIRRHYGEEIKELRFQLWGAKGREQRRGAWRPLAGAWRRCRTRRRWPSRRR